MLLASQERLALDFWRESTHKHYKRGLQLTLYFLPARGHQFLLDMLITKVQNTIKGLFYLHLFTQNLLNAICYSHKVCGFQAEGQCDIAP